MLIHVWQQWCQKVLSKTATQLQACLPSHRCELMYKFWRFAASSVPVFGAARAASSPVAPACCRQQICKCSTLQAQGDAGRISGCMGHVLVNHLAMPSWQRQSLQSQYMTKGTRHALLLPERTSDNKSSKYRALPN